MQFTVDQQKAIDTRGKNILVAAAAGSGKTRVLVERIIGQLIAREFSVDEILVVTFTNAAAAEMRERIELALNERLETETDPETVRWLERQLVLLTGANIETFHAFCQRVIRQYIDAIDVDPEFRLASEQEMVLMKRDVLEDMLERGYERPASEADVPAWERFIEFVDDYGDDQGDSAVYDAVLKLYHFSQSQPFPAEWLTAQAGKMTTAGEVTEGPWLATALVAVETELMSIIAQYDRVNALVTYDAAPELQADFEPYVDVVNNDLERLENLLATVRACRVSPAPGKWDAIVAQADSIAFLPMSKNKEGMELIGRKTKDLKPLKADYPQVHAKFDRLRKAMKDSLKALTGKYLLATEAQLVDDLAKAANIIAEYTRLTLLFMAELQAAKRERNVLDFNDLEHFALEILCAGAADGRLLPSTAADALREEFAAIMVDEYQDTNGVQEAILDLIARENNRFIVGDVKQSIYRFRLADPTLFQDKYARYPEEPGEEDNDQLITMRQNFRSRAEVLAPINYIFDQVMTAEAAEIEYDERSRLYPGAEFPECEGQTLAGPLELNIIVRGGSADADDTAETRASDDADDSADDAAGEQVSAEELAGFALEAQFIADRIHHLIAEEQPLVFDHGSYRPIEYRDIAVLLRAVSGKANILLETLRHASIPAYANVDGGYFEATEVRLVLALLAVIDNARQDIPLAAVLASPMGGFSMEDLTRLRLAAGDGDLYDGLLASFAPAADGADAEPLPADLVARAGDFFEELAAWRSYSVSHSVPELIWLLYRETGYYDYVGSLKGGLLRQANLRMLADRAADYERTNYRGLFRFLRYIEDLQKRDTDLAVARTLGASENVVRIMSIHKSKGLEFPVVILADTAKQFNLQDAKSTFLLHKEMGIGPKIAERSRVGRQIYKTLPWQTVADKIIAESKAEELRVLYVAMTRAKERLILTGVLGEKTLDTHAKKWYENVARTAAQLPPETIRDAMSYLDWIAPAVTRHADGAPLRELVEGEGASYVGPFLDLEPGARFTVRLVPSAEVMAEEGQLDASDPILAAVHEWQPLPPSPAAELVQQTLAWHYATHGLENVPAKLTVTEIKRRFELADSRLGGDDALRPSATLIAEAEDFAVPRFMQAGERKLSAADRGTAMHTALQHIDLTAPATIDSIRRQLTSMVERGVLTAEEQATIYMKSIQQFLESPIGARLRRAQSIYRELPFSRMLDASRFYPDVDAAASVFTQGVIDLLFVDENGDLVLVDYKTDSKPSATKARARYSVQLALYREAVESLLARPVAESYIYLVETGELVDMR